MRRRFFDRRGTEGVRSGMYLCTWALSDWEWQSIAENRQALFETISKLVVQLAEKFLDNFLKKTIILNELANAKTFVLRENQTILTQSNLSEDTILIKSLILAQDERWRRA